MAFNIWKSVSWRNNIVNGQFSIRICNLYNESKIWVKKYKRETRVELENHWSKQLSTRRKKQLVSAENARNDKDKFYCLSMFPYPSGKLHMGHVRVYTISDVMAHYHRMNGKEVLHPMGWDSFGLPAENAAILHNLDPGEWTEKNIAYMKQQMLDLDLCFDWNVELSTCQPKYFKWTQYLFLELFHAGMAYRKKALVNWDPVDKTVLAHEQVDDEGRSWRSGAIVEKKLLEQWFLQTTKYSKSLLDTLDEIKEDVGIKLMQKHWIGNIDGCFINCVLEVGGTLSGKTMSVFCSHPECIPDATHINLHSEYFEEISILLKDVGATDNIIDVLKQTEKGCAVSGIYAINPFTNARIPFVISNQHMQSYGKSLTVLGIPHLHEVDGQIADANNLFTSKQEVRMTRQEALAKVKNFGCGPGYMTSSCLRDWLISRQRRWGTPIPVVYCPIHGTVAVPEEELPVTFPLYNETLDEWRKTVCPKCGGSAIRETDTMDTFVDSSWYFMRFTDPHNDNSIFSKEQCDRLMPVDLYIGGIEHAILHLYYARFISHFCADLKLTKHREPFKKILAQGIIKGKTYRARKNGKYLGISEVETNGSRITEIATGDEVDVSFEKMSKSKLNGVDPLDFVSEWGITMTRLFVLYAAAPSEVIHWDVKTDIIPGLMRWQMKLWRCVNKLLEARQKPAIKLQDPIMEYNIAQHTNQMIKQVTEIFEDSCTLSAAITHFMTIARFADGIEEDIIRSSSEFEKCVCAQVVMATPMMPHFTSELWNGLQGMQYKLTDQVWGKEALDQPWPKPVELQQPQKFRILINNKHCSKVIVPSDLLCEDQLEKLILLQPKVKKALRQTTVKKVEISCSKNIINVATFETCAQNQM